MPLFQKSVLNKYLKAQDIKIIDDAFLKFSDHFLNTEMQEEIRNMKEEEYQDGFLEDLFVNVLGYTKRPKDGYNLIREKKNQTNSKKADGAVLKNDSPIAVIELKGTETTNLDKITSQAFGYKNNHIDCIYVVTSNFEKLRFYINNTVEHIEFNLFTLKKDEFKILWLCLQEKNLLDNVPLKVKKESIVVEEIITKKLYKDYSAFKTELWQNICKSDSEKDQLLLFKKTQKLLDRFLFIFFAEDCGLLPPNSISRMVERYDQLIELDAQKPLYEIFKQYFGYINTGRDGKTRQDDIFAYNGGLFSPDVVLEDLKIDDDLLKKHVLKLTAYDFQSDVDVNILGHIFENSLNEIENVTAKLEGRQIDKNQTKRKKDGVFYTPKYITKYIVDNTIGKLCEEKKNELGVIDEEYAKGRRNRKKDVIKMLDVALQEYRQWLLNITICDPACGSGAFLNQAIEFLVDEHSYIADLEAQLHSRVFGEYTQMALGEGVENHILENNIFGVDINDESVEIAKLSLWLRTAQRGRKLTSLNNNIKCGNSLIDDPELVGEKAFDWKQEFPDIDEKGGFDVVIGNPPYVGQKGNKEIFEPFKTGKWATHYERKQDLYYYFLIQSLEIASLVARIGVIVPQYWLTALGASKIRTYLSRQSNLESVLDVSKDKVFPDAGINSMVFLFNKRKDNNQIQIFEYVNDEIQKYESAVNNSLLSAESWHIFKSKNYVDLSIVSGCKQLGEICNITPGIQTGADKVSQSHINKLNLNIKKGEGIFVVSQAELELMNLNTAERNFVKPFYKNSDIRRYQYNSSNKDWIIITNSINDLSAFPNLERHLSKYKVILDNRFRNFALKKAYENGAWWYLYGYRPNTDFEGDKIIFPYRSNQPKFAFTDQSFYGSIDVYYITNLDSKYSFNELVAILNSKLIRYFIKKNCKIKGKVIEFYTEPMSKIPIKKPSDDSLDILAKKLSTLYKKLSEIQNRLTNLLSVKYYNGAKIKTKINLLDVDFNVLTAELNKNNTFLTLEEADELLSFHSKIKNEYQNMSSEINSINSTINTIVYELYELSKDEIEIIENN